MTSASPRLCVAAVFATLAACSTPPNPTPTDGSTSDVADVRSMDTGPVDSGDPCAQLSTCGACTANAACAFCASSGRCLPRATGVACDPGALVSDPAQCSIDASVDVGAMEAGADASAMCPMGLTSCGGACVDSNNDRNNCGACGRSCAASENCAMGVCVERCPLGQMRCGVACVDTTVDLAHCGACDHPCASRERCVMSSCVPDCPAGQSACGGACVDTTTSNVHCGVCGNACAASETCVSGMCRSRCAAGQLFCGGACVDPQSDNSHCGACGMACPMGQSCSMGTCSITCVAPTMRCSGVCINTTTSATNCGACGTVCPAAPNAAPSCAMSACGITCNAGFGNCDSNNANGCEVDTRTSLAHCGGCGRACTAGANQSASCSTGTCQLRCNTGFGDCDGNPLNGCENNLNTNVSNCGLCGRACPAPVGGSATCSAGVCGGSCAVGQTLCTGVGAGRCANLSNDTNNCGACGNVCAAGQSCVSGSCQTVCPMGQTACGAAMTCVDINTNAANCGACGAACAAGESCANGTCLAPFRVTNLGTTCNVVNTEALNGDQRGNLAVGASRLLGNADQGTASLDLTTPTTTPSVVPTQLDAALYDVFSGQVFLLGDATGPLRQGTGTHMVDRLWRTQQGVWQRASPIMLSTSFAVDTAYGANVGIYSGGNRAIVHTSNIYDINLTNGTVTNRGAMAQPSRTSAENFRTSGVVEQIGSTLYLTYPQNSMTISRSRIPDGLVTTAATFTNIGDAAHLAAYSAGANSRWLIRVEISSQFGSVSEALVSCPVTVTQNTTTGDFSMSGYATTGCTVIDTNAIAGDDRGPLVIGYGEAYVTGDNGTMRVFSATTPVVTSAAAVGTYGDHLVYNVRNGAVYGLYTDDLPLQSWAGTQVVNRIVPLSEGNLLPSGAPLTLSQPISIDTSLTSTNMVLSGWNRVLIITGSRAWNINLNNGEVRDFGAVALPMHTTNESWAATGIVESTGSATDIVYIESSTRIARMRLGTGVVSTALALTMIGDSATIGFSALRSRWYWQAEYTNQFASMPSAEWFGSCTGAFAN